MRLVVLSLGVGVLMGATGGWLFAQRSMAWPSYSNLFDDCAPVVVNVSLEGPDARVGSGFAVSDTEVVTARHLVLEADPATLSVRDISGRHYPAKVVGMDAKTDLALLAIHSGHLDSATLGHSEGLRVGDTVLAIGNPYGLGHSLSVGVVGNRGRKLEAEVEGPRVGFLQLSIPLNPGNSGGPIFDATGRVVGVLAGTHAQGQAIAFAVPVEDLRQTLPALREGARISRAFLGMRTRKEGGTLLVTTVIPSGPADRAGIRAGDRVSAFDGNSVATPDQLTSLLDAHRGGERATLRVFRDGELKLVDVVLSDWAEQAVVVAGMTLRPSPGAGGEVMALRPGSRAEVAGVLQGDIVRSVNGVPVRAPADVKDMIGGGGPVQVEVLRNTQPATFQFDEAG